MKLIFNTLYLTQDSLSFQHVISIKNISEIFAFWMYSVFQIWRFILKGPFVSAQLRSRSSVGRGPASRALGSDVWCRVLSWVKDSGVSCTSDLKML